MKLVVVESPAKAKTINKYLGSDYEVLASYGHVRDLPAKDGSVRPDEDFAMSWEVDAKSGKRLSDIVKAVKDADRIILATDPDREARRSPGTSWKCSAPARLSAASRSSASSSMRSRARRCSRPCAIPGSSTTRWSMPTSPAAPSTIW